MWNPLAELNEAILSEGGFVNAHSHLDRAYTVSPEDFKCDIINSHLHEKWVLVDKYKEEASEKKYFANICAALRMQSEQGIRVCLSFIDCDSKSKHNAIQAAVEAKKFAHRELGIKFLIANQTLKGVLNSTEREYFEKSLEFVDIIGGLPGADRGKEEIHLDVLFERAKATNKRLHVHVDQLNSATEKETELLAKKTMEWGLEGKVTAVHGISLASHSKTYRNEVYKMCLDAGLSFVSCPSAWIDSRRTEVLSPTHNSVTPIDEMIPLGIVVALGTDNICDLYKPYADGNMLTELRFLLESTHFYSRSELIKIATLNGRKVLGLI
jgi:cytosine/creatinine deaminase